MAGVEVLLSFVHRAGRKVLPANLGTSKTANVYLFTHRPHLLHFAFVLHTPKKKSGPFDQNARKRSVITQIKSHQMRISIELDPAVPKERKKRSPGVGLTLRFMIVP